MSDVGTNVLILVAATVSQMLRDQNSSPKPRAGKQVMQMDNTQSSVFDIINYSLTWKARA